MILAHAVQERNIKTAVEEKLNNCINAKILRGCGKQPLSYYRDYVYNEWEKSKL